LFFSFRTGLIASLFSCHALRFIVAPRRQNASQDYRPEDG
jgi:hypothetical protein